MKKFLFLAAAIATLGFAACGSKGPGEEGGKTEVPELQYVGPVKAWGTGEDFVKIRAWEENATEYVETIAQTDGGACMKFKGVGSVTEYSYYFTPETDMLNKAELTLPADYLDQLKSFFTGRFTYDGTVEGSERYTDSTSGTEIRLWVEGEVAYVDYLPLRAPESITLVDFTEPVLTWGISLGALKEASPTNYLESDSTGAYFQGMGTVMEYGYRFGGSTGNMLAQAVAFLPTPYTAVVKDYLATKYEYQGFEVDTNERGRTDIFKSENAYAYVFAQGGGGEYRLLVQYTPL